MATVERVMNPHVLITAPNERLDRTAQLMIQRKVGSAVVLDGTEIVGIITERDVLRAVARGLVPWSTSVSECMTVKPLTVPPSMPLDEALAAMLQRSFRHLPVADDGQLVGIVSLRDVVAHEKEPAPGL